MYCVCLRDVCLYMYAYTHVCTCVQEGSKKRFSREAQSSHARGGEEETRLLILLLIALFLSNAEMTIEESVRRGVGKEREGKGRVREYRNLYRFFSVDSNERKQKNSCATLSLLTRYTLEIVD